MTTTKQIPLSDYLEYPPDQMKQQALEFYEDMRRRRTVRHFSERPVPREIIENCLRAAGTAPSGANMQPWHFVVVSDPPVKRQIREASEERERAFYEKHAPQEWLDALAPLKTNAQKPFLEIAPYLIVIFAQKYGLSPDDEHIKHYYVQESVGIATGILIAAIHRGGLVCVTYTPSPMDFLNDLLKRPDNERPFLILAIGYPAEDATVPDIQRKSLQEIVTFV